VSERQVDVVLNYVKNGNISFMETYRINCMIQIPLKIYIVSCTQG